MNPTEAKFHDDLEAIASELDLGVRAGKFSWTEVQDRLKAKSGEWAVTTDRYVHEHTWRTIGLAAGLGVLIGLLIPSRR
jgi:ElaB/YqjD/DUF883 family membrane-anchored ribosome-binding protein